MADKGHFRISLAKSIIRIVGGSIAIWLFLSNLLIAGGVVFAGSFVIAEFLGIFEEVADKRK